MKKLYLVLIVSLITSSLIAQSFTEVIGTPFNGLSSPIAIADIDNDNDLDAFIGRKIYVNDGNGLFEYKSGFAFEGVTDIAFADIDGDDDQDVMVSYYITYSGYEFDMSFHIALYKNDGNGSFTGVSGIDFIPGGFGSVNFADVDNDNDQDVIISGFTWFDWSMWGGGPTGPQVNLYLNDGNGLFTLDSTTNFIGVGGSSVALADVDNDNDLDILITGLAGSLYWGGDRLADLYLNDGNGIFTLDSTNAFDGIYMGSIAFADIDNDEDQDVVITGKVNYYDNFQIKLYLNDGSGFFTEAAETPFDGVSFGSIAFADIDNDNDKDLLAGNRLHINVGNGNFVSGLGTAFNIASPTSVEFADIDNDNDPDVLISGENVVKLYTNNLITTRISEPNPLFNDVSIYPNPNHGQVSISLGDLKEVSIEVYTISGQLIYQKENLTDPTWQFELDAIPGLYLIELNAQGHLQHYKLIKQ